MTRVLSGDEGIGPGSRVSVLSMTKAQDDKYLVSYDWPNSWKHGVTKYSQCDTTRNSWLVNILLPLLMQIWMPAGAKPESLFKSYFNRHDLIR